MRKLLVVGLTALVAAASFAPASQARTRKMKPAPMVMAAPMMNPRMNAMGEFYATPVQAGDPSAVILAPLGVPGAVVGGVTQPLLAPISAPGGVLPGIDLLPH